MFGKKWMDEWIDQRDLGWVLKLLIRKLFNQLSARLFFGGDLDQNSSQLVTHSDFAPINSSPN